MQETGSSFGICGVCPGGCAIVATLQDGRLTNVQPCKEAKFGALCIRGKFAPDIIYSPDRLKKPLLRIGERGQGSFREASWDEALDYAVAKMLEIKGKYGPQAMVSHSGRGAFEQAMIDLNGVGGSVESRLLLEFGSPNISGVGSLCNTSFSLLAPMTTVGMSGRLLVPDIDHSRLIVIWGTNTATDSPPFIHERILEAKRRGSRIIVIDPRRSENADAADQWVAVRPGTDGALVLGILSVIVDMNWVDRDFVEHWVSGFNDLKAYLNEFPVEKVAEITGVPTDTIIQLAREISQTEHATIRMYTGLEYSNCGVQALRGVYILWALSGHLDVPGGLLINLPEKTHWQSHPYPRSTGIKPLGASEYPLFHKLTGCAQFMEFPRAVLRDDPYPVRGLINVGASILTSYPQPRLWEEAFQKLDFMLVVDRFMTRDAQYADVVLPATTYFEIQSYQRYPGFVRLRERLIKPCGESRNDLLIMAAIAKRLGFGEKYPQTDEEILQKAFVNAPELLEELRRTQEGIAYSPKEREYRKYKSGKLRPDGQPGFNTPSGKFEIASDLLADCGYEKLPVYVSPQEGATSNPELYRKYPLILNSGARIHSKFRSQHLNIPGLLRLQPRPEVLLNPHDADSRGIVDGETVKVLSPRGQVVLTARVTDKIMAGCVEVNMGGGNPVQSADWREANVNVLTDYENRDPISGFPVFKALLCQVKKMANE